MWVPSQYTMVNQHSNIRLRNELTGLEPGDPPPTPWKPGLWTHYVVLVQIFGRVLDLNRRLVFPSDEDKTPIEEESQRLALELEDFERNLPADVRYSEANLAARIADSTGRMFVALHLGYHHYSTLLYYHYLENHKLSFAEPSRLYINRCKYHAAAFSDIVRVSLANNNAEAVYNIVGHMTVVSSSVLVHTVLFGGNSEVREARERLEVNFQLLVKLGEFCKYHAAAFSDIVRVSLANNKAEAVYNIVGHMTVVSSSVLVHTVLFGGNSEVREARERLEVNFQLLVKLGEFWPSVTPLMAKRHTIDESPDKVPELLHRVNKSTTPQDGSVDD
ncbi:hypothetical protein V498_04006 [Pseudogymnoascus sp. VKM F-4517 (FW-2822)]|nr:hypothetical protein V498_04006 [Pseudogymnoascus sp. VKM F-4517 (FW-2822)]